MDNLLEYVIDVIAVYNTVGGFDIDIIPEYRGIDLSLELIKKMVNQAASGDFNFYITMNEDFSKNVDNMMEARKQGAASVENNLDLHDIIKDAQEEKIKLDKEGFPFLYAIDLIVVFISENIGNRGKVLKIIAGFYKIIIHSKLRDSKIAKEILNIFYYMLYFKNPYANGVKDIPEADFIKYRDTLQKLAKRLLFLILSAKDGSRMEIWESKFLVFFYMVLHIKRPSTPNIEDKLRVVLNW